MPRVDEMLSSGVLAWRPKDIREEGREEGRKETEDSVIAQMILQGYTNTQITAILPRLSGDRIEKIREKLRSS